MIRMNYPNFLYYLSTFYAIFILTPVMNAHKGGYAAQDKMAKLKSFNWKALQNYSQQELELKLEEVKNTKRCRFNNFHKIFFNYRSI